MPLVLVLIITLYCGRNLKIIGLIIKIQIKSECTLVPLEILTDKSLVCFEKNQKLNINLNPL